MSSVKKKSDTHYLSMEKLYEEIDKDIYTSESTKIYFKGIIRRAGTEDVSPAVYGKKVESAISSTGLMSSVCYSNMDRDAVYCKYCGAKMKEGSENHE